MVVLPHAKSRKDGYVKEPQVLVIVIDLYLVNILFRMRKWRAIFFRRMWWRQPYWWYEFYSKIYLKGDGCSSTCTLEGNGWTCNTGVNPNVCQSIYFFKNNQFVECGNGVKEGTEVCDDNNEVDGKNFVKYRLIY